MHSCLRLLKLNSFGGVNLNRTAIALRPQSIGLWRTTLMKSVGITSKPMRLIQNPLIQNWILHQGDFPDIGMEKDKVLEMLNKEMESFESKNTTLNMENQVEKTGNEKRKESCKRVGAQKKIKGHKREKDFLKKYNPQEADSPIEYGATSDTTICSTHDICNKLHEIIKPSNLNVTNKSGNNIQLTLGNIPELKDINSDKLNKDNEYVCNIFNKYLKKSVSKKPAGIFVYKDTKNKKWIFFNTDDVVNYIVNNCKWRQLESGRIKGDFNDDSKKGYSQYITYEYRNTHNSYFLGFNGGKGIKFINLLKHPVHGIKYVEDDY